MRMPARWPALDSARRVLVRYVPPILGGVWIAAAWAKIVSPDESIAAIRAALTDFGPGVPVEPRWVLMGVIATELTLGFGLIFAITPRILLMGSAAVLVVLAAWLAFLAARNPHTPCGCGLKLGWWESGGTATAALIRNLVLLGAHAGVLACISRRGRGATGEQPSAE